jgi:Zn ribbon nucleic-acid-binding protein
MKTKTADYKNKILEQQIIEGCQIGLIIENGQNIGECSKCGHRQKLNKSFDLIEWAGKCAENIKPI